MSKSKFVYKLESSIPTTGKYGHFYVTILDLESITSDRICISWQCNLHNDEREGWYACHPKWEHSNYKLRPLLAKMEKAYINSGSEVKEVIDFLRANHIELAIFVSLVNDEQRPLYDGLVSVSEILNGKFARYDNKKKFTIPAGQQVRLIEQIQESQKMIMGPQRKIAA